MISKWIYLPLTADKQKSETELASKYADCPPVSELLAQRGISTVEEAEKFFHPLASRYAFAVPDARHG